jgi:methylenetetrahydrofolate reductase (NADPH)
MQNKVGLTTMAHYTSVNASREKVESDLTYLKSIGIENMMLLRGDPPKGEGPFVPHPKGFAYASELISFAISKFDICAGGAAYVEKHPEAKSLVNDLLNLKHKVDAGADFLITQLFFNNDQYVSFVDQARKIGINCRIIPGIIPITAYSQIERFTKMSGASIPQALLDQIKTYKDKKEKIHQIGMDFAIQQCRDLLVMGAPGLHFYTLNKSRATIEIFETLLS